VPFIDALVPPDFRATISSPLRRLYVSVFLSCFGNGLTYSLFVVYLHNVRHFPIGYATFLLTISAIAGLMTGPLWGNAVDRLGPWKIGLFAYVADAACLVYWAFARTHVSAIIGTLLIAVMGGGAWGPNATLLTRVVPEKFRQRAFGLNFMMVNLGIGLGTLISATIVSLAHPASFEVLYVLNASIEVLAALFYLRLRGHGYRERHDDATEEKLAKEGWRVVLADHVLLRYVLAQMVLMIGGYGSLDAGFSIFVVDQLHLNVHSIGVIFFVNTVIIVLGQLFILNMVEGRSRTRVMSLVALCWAAFWFAATLSLRLNHLVAVAALTVAMGIFAIGETLLQPVSSVFINELAPEHLRGRYNAIGGLMWGISGALAPLFATLFYSHGLGGWWPAATGAECLLGGLLLLNLRRHLSPREDGRSEDTSKLPDQG
jgi:MFS family permease